MKKKNIIGVKCKDKFFITDFDNSGYNRYNSVSGLFINGKKPTESFFTDWCVIDNEPKTVQISEQQPDINHRYELIDKSMVSEKTPLVFDQDEVSDYDSENWRRCWKDEFKLYQSLYKYVSDKQDPVFVDVEFEYKTIIEVKDITEYKGFTFDVRKTRWKDDGLTEITEKDIEHQLIDKIVFPEILLPSCPSALSVADSYKIIRQYVTEHMNYSVAKITSDYDFCFTVVKIIPLSEVEKYTVDANLWKKTKRIKYETKYRRHREVACFEMTPSGYKGYTTIKPFRGDNQEDLQNTIDTYCKALVAFINEPLSDCPECKGNGVILKELPKES